MISRSGEYLRRGPSQLGSIQIALHAKICFRKQFWLDCRASIVSGIDLVAGVLKPGRPEVTQTGLLRASDSHDRFRLLAFLQCIVAHNGTEAVSCHVCLLARVGLS